MKTQQHNRFIRFMRRRRISAVVLVVVASTLSSYLFVHVTNTQARIAAIEQASGDEVAAMDKVIDHILTVKAAELKAKQEAAAKATAKQATTADATTAASIDSLTCNTSQTHNDPNNINVVVNKKHCIQPVTYTPHDLVDIGGGYQLSAKAAPAFAQLMAAANNANQALSVTSSYRSYNDQVATYAYWVNASGSDGADTYSARPGYSEHQTGLVIDVADANKQYVLSNFKQTSQYQWLLAHAAEYGFIQRYYEGYTAITGYTAEEWHYRYVGVDAATDMKTKNIKTLEQYWGISGGDY